MAITSSAKKAIRSSEKKRVFNLRRKRAVQKAVKEIRQLLAAGKIEDAKKRLPAAYKAIDKAVKTHCLKKGAAARKKSRLTQFFKHVG